MNVLTGRARRVYPLQHMMIATSRRAYGFGITFWFALLALQSVSIAAESPGKMLADVLRRWADIVEPPAGQPAPTFTTKLTITKSDGLPSPAAGATMDLAFQAP